MVGANEAAGGVRDGVTQAGGRADALAKASKDKQAGEKQGGG